MVTLLMAEVVVGQGDTVSTSFREQYVRLSKEYSKAPDNVANLMELATFYSMLENPHYNLTLAAGYARRAEELYTAWIQDKGRYRDVQKLIRKGITIPVIRQKRKDLEAQAVLYVRSHVPKIDLAEATAFIETFSDNDEIVKRLRAKVLADTFEKVCQENTIEGYYSFIQAYPNTAEADSAEAALARLAPRFVSQFESEAAVDSAVSDYPASSALQQAAMRQKSRIAYLSARKENSMESYSDYLERYPRGDYYLETLDQLQQLRNIDFGLLSTPEELADFVESHSDDPLADSALAHLRNMVIKDHSQKAAQIYLSRFQLDEEYSNVYKHYYEWYAEEGNGQPIQAFQAAHPNYPFQMAVRSDLARAAIIDSVNLTSPFVEADYERLATGVHLLTGRKAAFVALQRILQQPIAQKDWAAAKARMQKFDLCFEDVSSSEYAELSSLLSDNSTTTSHLVMPADNISHIVAHPTDNYLCFSYTDNGRLSIGYARIVTNKKSSQWSFKGEIDIEGCTGNAVPYNFYDNGSKVLLGINNDIWSAQVINDSVWQLLEHFGSPINTPYVEQDAFMLEDGSGMLLVSDRPGGINVQKSGSYYHGDYAPAFDIYYIPFTSASWGNPVNLGMGVNTPYCERSPILSRNMRTLYYVTDARGLGYGDIYRVTRTDIDDWTHWSQPVNLGKGVNGAFDEASLTFGKGERSIYYTSATQPKGKNACYSFPTRHDTSSACRRIVINMDDVSDVLRQVEWVEVWRQRSVACMKGRQLDTAAAFSLYRDKPYALLADADWIYVPTLSIRGGEKDNVSLQGYTLEELKLPVPLPLTSFLGNTAQLQPLAHKELRVLAHFLQQHAGCQIELLLHTDGTDEKAAYALSLQRATAIRNFLVGCGIDAGRIHLSAYGNVAYKQGLSPYPVAVRFF